jgi:hypothetical protein
MTAPLAVFRLASAAAFLGAGLSIAVASPLNTAPLASGSQLCPQISMTATSYSAHVTGASNIPQMSPIIVPPPPGVVEHLMASSPIIVPPPPGEVEHLMASSPIIVPPPPGEVEHLMASSPIIVPPPPGVFTV